MATAAFFAKLPARLSPVEAELRDLLLRAATAAKRVLPASSNVTLQDWVEHRMPGEVKLSTDAGGRVVLGLVETASTDEAPKMTSAIKEERREEFFSSLPEDSFTPEEERLRTAIHDFLARWESAEPANLSHMGGDRAVQQARTRLLPQPIVSLRDWIERRIGGEIELKPDRKGQFVVHLTPAGRPFISKRYGSGFGAGTGMGAAGAAGDRDRDRDRDLRDRDPRDREPRDRGGSGTSEFLRELPKDELLPAEMELREALISFVHSWVEEHGGQMPVLANAGQDRAVQRCKANLLPSNTSLHAWIDARIGGEVTTSPHSNGQVLLGLSGAQAKNHRGSKSNSNGAREEAVEPEEEAPDERAKVAAEKRDTFFAQLPEDAFTPEEETLREALISYLQEWPGDSPPLLSYAGGDPRVRDARAALLPKGCGASLREWIERRIGGELETSLEPSSMQVAFGWRGHFDVDQDTQARGARKRKAEAWGKSESGGYSGGGGGIGIGAGGGGCGGGLGGARRPRLGGGAGARYTLGQSLASGSRRPIIGNPPP